MSDKLFELIKGADEAKVSKIIDILADTKPTVDSAPTVEPVETKIPWDPDREITNKYQNKTFAQIKNDPNVPDTIKRQKLDEAWGAVEKERSAAKFQQVLGVEMARVEEYRGTIDAGFDDAAQRAAQAKAIFKSTTDPKTKAQAEKDLRKALDDQWAAIEKTRQLKELSNG